jgi:hypothetical protein
MLNVRKLGDGEGGIGCHRAVLVREAPGVLAAGPQTADIVVLQFKEIEGKNRWCRRRDPFSVGAARHVRIQAPVVVCHDYAVAGDSAVELQRVHAELQREGERRQGVLGKVPARAAVALDVHPRIRG